MSKRVISFASPTYRWAEATTKFKGRCRICVLLFFSFLSLITSQVLEVWAFYCTVRDLNLFCLLCDLLELPSLELSHLCNGFEGSCFVCLKGLFWINSWLRRGVVNMPKALYLWGLVWRDLQYEMRDLGLSSGSVPSMVTGLSERVLGDPETIPVSPTSHPCIFIFSEDISCIWIKYPRNYLDYFVLYFHLFYHVSHSNMCTKKEKKSSFAWKAFAKKEECFLIGRYCLHVFLMKQKPVGLWFLSLFPFWRGWCQQKKKKNAVCFLERVIFSFSI